MDAAVPLAGAGGVNNNQGKRERPSSTKLEQEAGGGCFPGSEWNHWNVFQKNPPPLWIHQL